MRKVFGYSKKDGKDWFPSNAYTDKEIESIKDPEGGSGISLPTAIPSPFARMDLVKTAFRNISKTEDLRATNKEGNVIASREDERLVSYCLDLAEMVFNMDSVKDQVRIVIWDRQVELNKMKTSSDKGQKRFAETLELYLNQDKESYNFDLLRRIFLIVFNNKVIGGTSPVTLFFPTGNDLAHAQVKLTTNDTLFDNEKYVPLYQRDVEFQKYFYYLFEAHPELYRQMADFANYLKVNLDFLDSFNPSLFKEIKELVPGDYFNLYEELNTGTTNSEIDVIGVALRKRKSEDLIDFISINSDFRIASTKYTGDRPPLVLQNDFSKDWLYAKGRWNKFKVPFVDPDPIDRRKLPEINIQYPYLTVSDFLEPYLIRLIYPINKDKFFDGNLNQKPGEDPKGYILPVKPLFFDYFNSDDLMSPVPGKPQIEMQRGVSNSVKVSLKIPVAKGGYIAFERIYFQTPDNLLLTPDEQNNNGVIVEHQFGITLFPFIKTNNSIQAFYRVQLVDRDVIGLLKSTDYNLQFFSNDSGSPVKIKARKIRNSKKPGSVDTATSQYYVLDNNFDFIQVTAQLSSGASGIIIPKWESYQQGNEVFSFAIDFGTTNTHIEYKIANGSPQPFDITSEDIQIATLFNPSRLDVISKESADDIYKVIEHEFLPATIGKDQKYYFPHRTVISESPLLNIETETFTMADFNIPFIYEREPERDKIITNLKWAKKEKGNEIRVRAFFEKVIMMIRNKVLLNKGDLSATRLIWFYPSSMKPARKSSLESAWKELFGEYFHPNPNPPSGITESLAPFYYFLGADRLQGGSFKPVVSIDIGGGTTDVVVFKSNKPLLMTSFKFAANSIFGDCFSTYGNANTNGFITKYFPFYDNLLSTNKLFGLSKVLSSIRNKNKAEDINAFFFSIQNNREITNKKLFSYNAALFGDEDLKVIFLYFYSAIIYHIAELMKINNVELPRHLVFSGTGSKILNIITPDTNSILSKLTVKIFEGVYNQKFGSDGLKVEMEKEMPKEVTCKGGLMSQNLELIDISDIKSVFTCVDGKGLATLTYNNLDDALKDEIVNYVVKFNSFFLDLNKQLSFINYFNVSKRSLDIFISEINKDLRGFLETGITFNRDLDEVSTEDVEIEETLFFYPITGVINNLTKLLAPLSPAKI